ncbi:alpha-2-macroglobulin family protein [Photobacterium salinisoli]|uniref:alpha-2-macroglobulin family protein n=1 Tax=Photobacterium salinisoli TaxID=1616783 RepID=UPI000EA1D93C|nr:MG2 domain-containing protein [Photobacterium salinisoli]
MVISINLAQWRQGWLLLCLSLFSLFSYAETNNETSQQTPDVLFVGSGPLVPQSSQQSIPVNFINLDYVDIEILQVTEPGQLLNRHYLQDKLSSYDLDNIKHAYKSVFSDRYTLPPSEKDVQTPARLPIPHSLDAGWYIVVIKAPGTFYRVKAKHMLLTDVGIQARINTRQAAFSLARLSTGDALTQGVVEIYRNNTLLDSQPVDLHGVARFDIQTQRKDIVIARVTSRNDNGTAKEEIAILPLREAPLDLADSAVGGRKYQATEAYIYSNRDLVKPGESLPVNILLRDKDGKALSSRPVSLSVVNPWNEEILKEQLQPQAEGYYFRQLETEANWKTGRYRIEVRLDPTAPDPISELSFQFEEFVPERMDLTFQNAAPFVFAGQANKVELNGRYLFGSPAAGNTVKSAVTYAPVTHIPGKFDDYAVGVPFTLDANYQELKEAALSEEGRLTVNLPTPDPKQIKSPVKTVANFSLLESGGAAVQRKLSYVTWKNQPVPGIKPEFVSVPYNTDALFKLALLSADGQSLTSGELEVTMDYDQGPYYWVYEDGIGWKRKKQERWKRVSSQRIKVGQQPESLAFSTKWGDYLLTVTDVSTGVSSSYSFYAGWYEGNEQLKAKPDHLVIQTDKPAYATGGQATFTVTAPLSGSLLVTLEADQLVWSESYPVQAGKVTVTVPVPASLARHDVFLTTTLTGRDGQTPKRYFGITPLKLDRSSRKLNVALDLPDLIKPSETLSVPVTVDNIDAQQGGDTWVTLSMVDKGIINLSRFKPVNPHDYFFGQRRYSADVIDMYSRLYDLRPDPFAQSRFGSDANEDTDNKNDGLVESKSIILMTRPVKLVDGKAVVDMAIPDYNGEAQIVATVFNGSQVGQAVLDKPISAPVVAELSVPRFLVPGDQSSVTVDLHNVSGHSQTLSVAITGSETLNFNQQPATELVLKDGEHWSQSYRFGVSDTTITDRASLTLSVNNQEISIDRSWGIPVRPVMPWVTQAQSVLLDSKETYNVSEQLWSGLDVVRGSMGHAYFSRTPVLNTEEHARGLFRYPYGCAEQTTSKAWPFLMDDPELQRFKAQAHQSRHGSDDDGSDAPSTDKQLIEKAVQRLKTMQKNSGGFSLWDSSGRENPWLSAYVTDFLLVADKRFPEVVPASMLSKASNRLMVYVRNESVTRNLAYDTESAKVARAYAAYLMSKQGKLKWSDLDSMKLTSLPTQLSYLHMAASYANVGASDEAEDMLDDIKDYNRRHRYFGDYGSNLRDVAKSVTVLQEMGGDHSLKDIALELQTKYLERLIELANTSWMSTQERAALVQASALTNAANRDQIFNLSFSGNAVSQTGMFSQPLASDMTIQNLDDKPVYVKVLAEGYQTLNRGIANEANRFNTLDAEQVERKLYTMKGEPLASNRVKVGDRVVVVLTVALNERVNDALLVDKIPAGFVLENPALNQGLPIERVLPAGIELKAADHQEYRNDRFVLSDEMRKGQQSRYGYILRAEVPGTFAVPPVFIESMYRPEKHLAYWQTPQTITVEK